MVSRKPVEGPGSSGSKASLSPTAGKKGTDRSVSICDDSSLMGSDLIASVLQ